ncbi:MAG: SpaH/EbpB family LPXTG-anchored major pilin [Oscillospiraceae bacterium]
MKTFKRFGAIFIAALLLLTLSLPALAVTVPPPPGSITMQDEHGKTKTESAYVAHKIVTWSATVSGVYNDMVLNGTYRPALIKELGAPLTETSTDGEILKALAAVTDTAKVAKLAVALSQVIDAGTPAVAGVFSNLSYGYYLVIETSNGATDGTVRSKPILVSVPDHNGTAAVVVTVKTSKADVDKHIVGVNNGAVTPTKTAQLNIGDVVDFKLTATVPTYAGDVKDSDVVYVVEDTLSKGLKFNYKSDGPNFIVKDSTGATLDSVHLYHLRQEATPEGGNRMQLTFVYGRIKDLGQITIEYSATLCAEASVGAVGNPNRVTLQYSNNPGVSGSVHTTPPKHTIVYTTGIKLTKIDGSTPAKPLAGAQFRIYKNAQCEQAVPFYTYNVPTDGSERVLVKSETGIVTTGADGIAYFAGLTAGDYYIREIKAPDGYDLLKDPIHIKIGVTLPLDTTLGTEPATWRLEAGEFTVENGIFLSAVKNTLGFHLPGTGGMGTTIFTVAGVSILALAGGLCLLYYKKKRA